MILTNDWTFRYRNQNNVLVVDHLLRFDSLRRLDCQAWFTSSSGIQFCQSEVDRRPRLPTPAQPVVAETS